MTALLTSEPIAVWLHRGQPARLVWRGRRYRVTDQPTPLRDEAFGPGMTHPLARLVGFRCQGTDEDGLSYVFDLHHSGRDWVLTAVYD